MKHFIPVLHSVSYSGAWPGQASLSVTEFIGKASALGYPAIALVAKDPHVSPLRYNAHERAELRKRIADAGLDLAAIMGYTDFTCGLRQPGIPSAELNAAYVTALCQLCEDLGCKFLRIFTGYRLDSLSYDTQYQEVLHGIRLSAEAAQRHQVTLLLQNHHDVAAHYSEFAWLLQQAEHPHLKAAFDCWSCYLHGARGEELRRAVQSVKQWMAFTTVADYKVFPQYKYHPGQVNYTAIDPPIVRAVAPGSGVLDYRSFFMGLRDIQYQGYVAYEMCAPLEGGGDLENLDRTARLFLEFLDQMNALPLEEPGTGAAKE
ncbi:MAG: sugar phosphate isomerase/epimerase [Bryobacterales bacterium]|nr:sugar phosphate isomerase/epimerase [Bryobacterales bacterium]